MSSDVHPGRRLWAACAGSLLVFAVLAWQLLSGGVLVREWDPAATAWLAAHRTALATGLLVAVTQLHSTIGIDIGVALVFAFVGLRLRRWRHAVWFAAAVESAMLLNVLLKHAFERARPDLGDPLVHLATFSFPSGHALAATAFWGCLACLVPAARRTWAISVAGVLVALVCLSRVYLGAHFLSDVAAGVCEGVFCVSLWRLALPSRQ